MARLSDDMEEEGGMRGNREGEGRSVATCGGWYGRGWRHGGQQKSLMTVLNLKYAQYKAYAD